MEVSAQTHFDSPQISVAKSSRSTKSSHKFSSLRGIIRIPVRKIRNGSISSNQNGPNVHLEDFTESQSSFQVIQPSQQHHSRSQSTEYTPPPSAFPNSPYGRHSRSSTMKPYMSQPMLGLGLGRDSDGGHSLDLDGDDTSSYSVSPERSRSPVGREASSSVSNLHRVVPWTAVTPPPPRNNAQTHAPSRSSSCRMGQDQNSSATAHNGVPIPDAAQRPNHTRKLSAQSISNAIVNRTAAGLAAIGVKKRRMSVDETSRPQTTSSKSSPKAGRSLDVTKKKPDVNGMALSNRESNDTDSKLQESSKSNTIPSSSAQRRKAPNKPLPPEPTAAPSKAEDHFIPTIPTISTSSHSAEKGTQPHSIQNSHRSSQSTHVDESPPITMDSTQSVSFPAQSQAKSTTTHPPDSMNMRFVFPSTQPAGPRPPSGALAPAATSLTTSQNQTNIAAPSQHSHSNNGSFDTRNGYAVKRAMTTGDEPLRLNLSPLNPRLTLHEVLESNSARLSPSVILRPPPLPLINLPMLSTSLGGRSGVDSPGGAVGLRRSLSHAGGSRRAMKCMPALPMQGTSRGTRGHEELDDIEDDDDDDEMDEEDEEMEDGGVDPLSASTGRLSMDSEMSTDDDGGSELGPQSQDDDMQNDMPRSPSRTSSYETAIAGDEEPEMFEPSSAASAYFGNPTRPSDKRFSRAPHLPRVQTSKLRLDFSIWDQKIASGPKTPTPFGATFGRVQEQQPGSTRSNFVDEDKSRITGGATGVIGETQPRNENEFRQSFFATEDEASRTPIGGTEALFQNHGTHGFERWKRDRTDAQSSGGLSGIDEAGGSEVMDHTNKGMQLGGGEGRANEHDVTKSSFQSYAKMPAAGTSSSNGTISAVPGTAAMDYFYYGTNSSSLPPLGHHPIHSRSDKSTVTTTSSVTSLHDTTPTMSATTTTTTIMNPSRGASPLRTPRPADYRLSINATTPLSPSLGGFSPLLQSKVSEARLSVTMGSLGHGRLYKMASKSLIDVHAIETKERVEKMMKDEEDAAEREHKAKKKTGKTAILQTKVIDPTTPALDRFGGGGGEIELVSRRDSRLPPNLDDAIPRTPPHSADPVMAGAAKRASMLNPALSQEASSREEDISNRRISAAPAYDALPHPLRRRRSMPTFNPNTEPPPYPDFAPHGLKKSMHIQPREDEGKEKLPSYSNSIYLQAVMPRKMEFSQPGQQAKDRKWRKVLCVLEGTAFKVYELPAATGVSAIGKWWENKVGAGDSAEPANHPHAAGGTSGFRITTDTGRTSSGQGEASQSASARKSGEGGDTGTPVLRRENSGRAQSSNLHHHSSHSVTAASTRSALNLAVSLLKPSPRHGRSNSDVVASQPPPRSPRASLNVTRSGRTTPTSGIQGSSLRSHSPSTSTSTHLTTPSSSSAISSRPTTPSSAVSAAPSSSRSVPPTSSSSSFHRPKQQSKGKGKERNDVAKPNKADLIRSYTMQNAESGLGKDYLKRQHVIRVRLEGEQFLLQANNVESVIAWIEGFQSAANVALDLDDRPMPSGPIFPRRRRRRRAAAPAGSSAANTTAPSPTVPNGPLASVRPLERSAGRR